MSCRHASDLRSGHHSKRKALLDAKRLEAIRKRIAEGFYNRNDVRHCIAMRLARSLATETDEEGKNGPSSAGDRSGADDVSGSESGDKADDAGS
jgi:hypothetical protein